MNRVLLFFLSSSLSCVQCGGGPGPGFELELELELAWTATLPLLCTKTLMLVHDGKKNKIVKTRVTHSLTHFT